MKSLNKLKLKKDLSKMMISENCEIPIYVCENMKRDFINLLNKYANFSERNFKFSIKILTGSKYVFKVECLVDDVLIKNNNSQLNII